MKKILLCSLLSSFVAIFTFPAMSDASGVKPTSIQDTLNFAFSYSPNIKAAQEARQQSVHNVRMAEAGYYPTIGIWAGAGVEQNDTPTTRATNKEHDIVGAFSTGLQLSQTIWEGGKTSATVRMREEEVAYRGWQLMDSANSLAYSAISAHADVIRRRELVRLAQDNVNENKRILGTLRTRYNQGLSSEGDVKLVEGRLGRAQASLSAHQQGLRTAMATYMRVTGQPTPKNLQKIPMPTRIIKNVDTARDISINKNIRIQTDLAAIRSALANVDVARSEFAPRLSIDAGPTYSNQGYDDQQHQFTWSAMLNLQWDLYSGGRDIANVKSQAARVRELRQTLHQTMDQLNEEIIATFATTESSKEQTKYYTVASKAAKQAKANYTAQFNVGQKDLLSVLDAEGEYFFSAVEKEIRGTDSVLGEYRMLALTGELLEELNINGESLKIDTTAKATPQGYQPWSFKASTLDQQEALSGTTLTAPR